MFMLIMYLFVARVPRAGVYPRARLPLDGQYRIRLHLEWRILWLIVAISNYL